MLTRGGGGRGDRQTETGETDRQTDRQRETGRARDRETDRQRQSKRQRESERQRQSERQRESERQRQSERHRERERQSERQSERERARPLRTVGAAGSCPPGAGQIRSGLSDLRALPPAHKLNVRVGWTGLPRCPVRGRMVTGEQNGDWGTGW